MFLDTSGLMCLFDRRDRRHSSSIRYFENAEIRLMHNYVLAEFVALATARKVPRLQALYFINELSESSAVETVWVGADLHTRGLNFLLERTDKALVIM